eukprot:PLAT3635.7.p1 GENE.PLAT3635.7~~PLAT3635.7.p1  ORF type:complete len:565 (+),score=171.41 PLAT3635.7:73-1767(+)
MDSGAFEVITGHSVLPRLPSARPVKSSSGDSPGRAEKSRKRAFSSPSPPPSAEDGDLGRSRRQVRPSGPPVERVTHSSEAPRRSARLNVVKERVTSVEVQQRTLAAEVAAIHERLLLSERQAALNRHGDDKAARDATTSHHDLQREVQRLRNEVESSAAAARSLSRQVEEMRSEQSAMSTELGELRRLVRQTRSDAEGRRRDVDTAIGELREGTESLAAATTIARQAVSDVREEAHSLRTELRRDVSQLNSRVASSEERTLRLPPVAVTGPPLASTSPRSEAGSELAASLRRSAALDREREEDAIRKLQVQMTAVEERLMAEVMRRQMEVMQHLSAHARAAAAVGPPSMPVLTVDLPSPSKRELAHSPVTSGDADELARLRLLVRKIETETADLGQVLKAEIVARTRGQAGMTSVGDDLQQQLQQLQRLLTEQVRGVQHELSELSSSLASDLQARVSAVTTELRLQVKKTSLDSRGLLSPRPPASPLPAPSPLPTARSVAGSEVAMDMLATAVTELENNFNSTIVRLQKSMDALVMNESAERLRADSELRTELESVMTSSRKHG